MWLWIAKEILKRKLSNIFIDVLKREYIEQLYLYYHINDYDVRILRENSNCFLCAYVNRRAGSCFDCPLSWGKKIEHISECFEYNNLRKNKKDMKKKVCLEYYEQPCYCTIYDELINEKDYRRKALLAYKISKLPERTDNV